MTIHNIHFTEAQQTQVKCLFCKHFNLKNYKRPDYKCAKGETVVNCRGQVCNKWRYCT